MVCFTTSSLSCPHSALTFSPSVYTLSPNCLFEYMFLQKSSVDVGAKMSLADRMKILKDKEEQWKNKGKGAANDSIQFTVAGRMAKRGDVYLVRLCTGKKV